VNIRRRNTPKHVVATPSHPRQIIKRSKEHVGEDRGRSETPPRTIVRRTARVGVQPVAEIRKKRRMSRPSFSAGAFDWRPGWKFYSATVAAVLFASAGAAGYWAWQTPYLQVREITVEGNSLISTEAIVSNSALAGERMITVDLQETQEALYQLPLIQDAKIEREWPHSVRIVITERQAWGTWEQSGVAYTIDREGVVLGTVPAPEGSPIIRSSQAGSRKTGDRVDYQAVDAAAEIYAGLPQTLGAAVAEIAYVPERGLQVTTADGETAIFGDSSSINYKLSVWAAMAQRARTENIPYTTIDLRYGNRPVLQ
jgi:cell division protein FtsQ